jgi:glycine/D-amino acid oxidase-like deaminating enzyme
MPLSDILIVGAGIFGMTAALELHSRGHRVRVVDAGPVPHPLAASTDISKVIRMEYGPDETYMAMMEEARAGWLAWNEGWRSEGGAPLYHETGVVMVCRGPMTPGGFEYESWRMLLKRGHHPERLDAEALARRFPAWNADLYVDGFFHAKGGYAESGRVVEALVRQAQQEGIPVSAPHTATALIEAHGRVAGIRDHRGTALYADRVVLATGAWAGKLHPSLGEAIRPTGHPVFHLKPRHPERFRPEVFPTFTADVARTGYYGFPLHPHGVVKIANHGVGVRIDPDAPRTVSGEDHERLRGFLARTFPDLCDAEAVYTRLCLYADTQDEDFWIAPDPEREGLVVAGGGSGHGFKFGPVLGRLTADAVEGNPNPRLEKFRWRKDLRLDQGREAARCHEQEAT